ncbi:MAG: crotonase/enoyl-CoA hydratase family protein [Acidimicrobiaceae bacterium]|jgi:enoyl-CoA hydratase/carnithine racemase
MDFQDIAYDVSEGIATITLRRPDKMNAFTGRMMHEIISALDMTDADDNVKVVIFTGSGRAYCAGADLSSGGETFAKGGSDVQTKQGVPRDGGGLVSLRIFESLKPVIGAINGAAVGVGVTMTLPMDIRLASDSAKFGFVFAKRGIVPEACSSYFLPRIVGIQKATEWVFTGRVFSAQEALDGGLVRSVHPADQLLSAARELAREIADNTAPVSVALSRRMLWRMLGASHPMEAHRADSRGIMERGRSADSKEGVVSFLEKRAAVYPDLVSDGLPDIFPGWEDPEFR